MKPLKVLVTGSEGYIGQHLCYALEKHYVELHKLDMNCSGGYKNYRVDIRSEGMLRSSQVTKHHFDAVIHLAAKVQVGESVQFPSLYYDTNVTGTLNLLKNLSYDKFIFASTGAASNPASPYGYSKLAAEHIVNEWADNNTICRFYNVTGSEGFNATNPDGLFYNLCRAVETGTFELYGTDWNTKDGTCVREYIHVMDICRALMKATDTKTEGVQNLGYGDTRTVKEIVNIFKEVNGVDFQVIYKDARPGDLESIYLDNPSELVIRNYTYEQMLKWKP
jgi:UDP-glucose 4-epimerase